MSYRDRLAVRQPTDAALDEFETRKAFARVFGTPEGSRVLDYIVQNICGVDSMVQYATDVQAFIALERKNVGLAIAKLALEPKPDKPTIKVQQ